MATITERRRRTLRPAIPVDDLFESLDTASQEDREELLYERASFELESGRSRKGMYAMALTRADGDRDRAQARYLELRVDQLASQFEAWEEDRESERSEADRRAEASADFFRTVFAIGLFLLGIVALVSWG